MKIKFNNTNNLLFIFWSILLLPIYKVGYISEILAMDAIYDVGRYFCILVCGIIMIKSLYVLMKDRDLLLLFLAKFLIVALTFLLGVKNNDCLYSFILVVLQGVLYTYMLRTNKTLALSVFTFVFELIVYINLITLILQPEGLYNYSQERIFTFIGHANNTLYYTLPLAALAIISLIKKGNKIRAIMDLVVCAASTVLIRSSTGIVVYLCFTFILLWEVKRLRTTKIKYFTFYLIILTVSIGFIFFNMQSAFAAIIEAFLKRDIDLTGRTYYWGRTLMMIQDSIVWGHGAVPGNVRWGGLTAHNYLLETLYEGGLILLGVFSLFFYKVYKKLDKYKSSREARVIYSAVAAITITCIAESNISNDIFFVLFIFALNVDLIAAKE